jgi:hypothetical protein
MTTRPVVATRPAFDATSAAWANRDRAGAVIVLSWTIAALAALAASVGLFWRAGTGPFEVTTVRGETVQLFGRGLYRYDTLFAAGGAHGTDAVVLLAGVPLLAASTLLYRRTAVRWRLLHTGVLACFLYIYASAALGTVAFNGMFLVYVALASASLFAVVRSAWSIDPAVRGSEISPATPRRGLAAFLFASGLVTMVVWGIPLVAALVAGGVPARLATYTTEVTSTLDLAAIVPLTFIAGAMVLRRRARGYLLALPLLVLETMLAPLIAAQTIGQLAAGVTFTTGEVVGPLAGFVVLAGCAAWFTVGVLRNIMEDAS